MKYFYHLTPKYAKHPGYIIRLWTGLSGPFATFLNKLHISANFVTSFRGLLVIYAIYCFATGDLFYYWQGSIILLLNQFLDAVDGDLARISKKESLFGEWLEVITYNPLAAVHGILGFSLAWGIYKQTLMIEVWYVLFFIPYAVVMNKIFTSFDVHETEDAAIMQEGFKREYNQIMKYSFMEKLYHNALYMNDLLIVLCVVFYRPIYNISGIHPLFIALIIICLFLQIKWLSRILLQIKFLISNSKKHKKV